MASELIGVEAGIEIFYKTVDTLLAIVMHTRRFSKKYSITQLFTPTQLFEEVKRPNSLYHSGE